MSQVSLKKIEAEKEFAQIHRGKGCENEAEAAVTGHKPRNATAIGSRQRARTMPPGAIAGNAAPATPGFWSDGVSFRLLASRL